MTDQEDFANFVQEMELTNEILTTTKQWIWPYGAELPRHLERVPSRIEGEGVFARRPIREGEVLANAFEDGLWTKAGLGVNHSTTPNSKLDNERRFIALQNIQRGDEITANYRQIRGVLLGENK